METQDSQQLFDGFNQAFLGADFNRHLTGDHSITVIFIGRLIAKALTKAARHSLTKIESR